MYNTGITNAAEQAADGEVLSCTMHDRKDGNVGEESAIKKKFQLFSARVSEYPISGVFMVLRPSGTEGVRTGEGRNLTDPLA